MQQRTNRNTHAEKKEISLPTMERILLRPVNSSSQYYASRAKRSCYAYYKYCLNNGFLYVPSILSKKFILAKTQNGKITHHDYILS